MGKKMVVYFGKINLESEHIYQVYSGELKMRDIMMDILIYFKGGMECQEEYSYMDEKGELHTNTINYSVYEREKTDTYIRGRLDKEFKLFYKEKDPETQELRNKAITNTDAVEFYFDVFSEMVGYNTSNRFGHKKFLEVFGKMLNEAAKAAGKGYCFSVARYTNGININNLYNELRNIGEIRQLTFVFKPVNPDTKLLESIQENGKGKLEEYEEANISSKSILLSSSSRLGLNLDSKLVRETMNEVDGIQKDVSAETATRNGYVKVEATGRDGITRSTEDRAPVKRTILRMSEFVKACEDVIKKRNRGSDQDEE